MLLELRIQNMALIDSLELEFTRRSGGLVVLTGETGAGKSIILQALHLLAGGRGASSWIRSEQEQAVVEALFSIRESQTEVTRLLEEHELADGEECIIRRIFKQNGRSRFFVNDRLVTAALVGELTENLVNIASQHDHQQLLVPRRHIDFLDTFGELWPLRREFAALYGQWQKLAGQLADLQKKEQEKEQQRDFLTLQLREIRDAAIAPGEDVELDEERNRLKASGALIELAGRCLDIMQTDMLGNLAEIRRNIEEAASLDQGLAELSERIVSSCYEVEDLEIGLREYLSSIPRDRFRLEEINERLSQLKQLMRKYGPTLENVIEQGLEAEARLASFDSLEQELAAVEKEVQQLSRRVREQADHLSRARQDAGEKLSGAMQAELVSLSFPQAVFEVAQSSGTKEADMEDITVTGRDQVEFLFSANPGEPVKPLAKIASGGELSRLMLALKCLLARRDQVETVVFDEVDAGIGGKAAEAVAGKIVELSGHHQVFCITHLPQIAARAAEHFMVNKAVMNGRTVSSIAVLGMEERVMELARMLGGANLTSQTIAYARELVEDRSGSGAQ